MKKLHLATLVCLVEVLHSPVTLAQDLVPRAGEVALQDLSWSLAFSAIALTVAGIIPIANPFSSAPMFAAITRRMSKDRKAEMARKTCTYMAVILLVFLLSGVVILEFFGVTFGGLQVAGGLVILYLGFRMLFPDEHGVEIEPDDVKEIKQEKNPALVPLAMPMLSGPGAIAVVISMATRIENRVEEGAAVFIAYLLVGFGIVVSAFLCWLVLRIASSIEEKIGPSAIDATTRILGFLLICIGVEFMRSGIVAFIAEAGLV